MNIKDQKGAAAVEFAIVLPVLLLILFGIIEFSVAFYDKAMITNASREGARKGILFNCVINETEGTCDYSPATGDDISDVVNDYLGVDEGYPSGRLITFSGSGAINVTVDPVDTSTLSAGDSLTVTVSYPYNFYVLPGFVAGLADGLTLSATTVMSME
jgi:Flp pilus assembly protein TadG